MVLLRILWVKNMKTEFENTKVLIKQDKRGYQPVIFLFENNRVYIIGITPDLHFDITDEGEIGDKWDIDGNWCAI